jgi:DNA primase
MRLPDGFLDELRARTPLAAIIGRRVKLARSGRNWKGCCPFHNEKSPSFYVYEDGYHCFGCGAHGDAVGFVMQSQGLQFLEAVELLAGEAGLEVPKPTQAAAEVEQRRLDLHDVLEAAARLYQHRLRTPEGARGLDYLHGRGLSDETIDRFGLGWAGETRGALAAEFARQDIPVPMLIEAGLMRESEDGRAPYDLFFNRVMFPIRDRRGRVISFGGRILGDGQPKYVNGPETPLFSKRRTLFGLDLARESARKGAEIVAVEGYMDVIALHQAGFTGAIAPLGTALTEQQLAELWRLSPMPVLCFDGDAAGQRAALRVADTAMPQLTPEQSLKLALLPAGEDPDTLVRKQGPQAFQTILDTAQPISTALFGLMAEGVGSSPEQRAGLRTRLETAAGRVADKALASEIRRALLDQFFASRPQNARSASGRPQQGFSNGRGRFGAPVKLPPVFERPVPGASTAASERARTLVAILLRHPYLLPDTEEAFAGLDLPEALQELRYAMLQWSAATPALDSASLITHLTQIGLAAQAAQTLSAVPVPLPQCTQASAMPAEAASGWWHFFGLMNPSRLEEEVAAARITFAATADDAAQRRLIALCTARDALRGGRIGWDEPNPDDPL